MNTDSQSLYYKLRVEDGLSDAEAREYCADQEAFDMEIHMERKLARYLDDHE